MEKVNSLIQTIDSCSLGTQIVMLIAFIVLCILVWKISSFLITIIKSGFQAEKLLNFFQRLIKIIIPLEIETIAGIINLSLTVGLLIITIIVFISSSLAGIIGFSENVSTNKILFSILTVIVAGVSLWGLHKFDKESKAIKNGGA